MRCIALAQGWKARGGQATFITACESNGLRQRLLDEGFQVIMLEQSYPDPADWEVTSEVLAAHPGAWVVLDGYLFDPAYQRQIKEAGHHLLVIDDMAHLDHYYADVVLNQNINAERLHYSCEPYTRLLLGTSYALLRREFLKWRGWKREIPEVAQKVLVTLGGGDPNNVTLKVIRAINKLKLKDLEIKVVIGPSNPHIALLKEAVHHSPFTIHLLPSAKNMPELMSWADVAVSAGGSTCWELAFIGLPSLIIVLAENQQRVATGLEAKGVAINLGWHTSVSEADLASALSELMYNAQQRQEMSERGHQLVNGHGSVRVVAILREVNV